MENQNQQGERSALGACMSVEDEHGNQHIAVYGNYCIACGISCGSRQKPRMKGLNE